MLSKIRRWHHKSVVSYTQVVVMQVFFSIVSHLGQGEILFRKIVELFGLGWDTCQIFSALPTPALHDWALARISAELPGR